jgi:uncharacterized heparinase superfamily protein
MSFLSVAANMRRAIGLRAARRTTRLEQLQVVPPNLRAADPAFSTELADGAFGLHAGSLKIGPKGAFDQSISNAAMRRELYAFGWLRHLDAARTAQAEDQARSLLLAWARSSARQSQIAREPAVAARRALSLLSHADTALTGAIARDFDRIMGLIGEEFAALTEAAPRMPTALARLTAMIALTAFHVCGGTDTATARVAAERRLAAELMRQILSDGGHLSRNPAAVLDTALDLLPLRRLYLTSKIPVPESINAALKRIRRMLVLLQHGDRQLGRFNSMGATPIAELSTVLKNLDWAVAVDDGASHHAVDTGYIRLSVGDAVILFDAGPGDETLAGEAPFAGALSFEFSSGHAPLIINCGSDHTALDQPRLEARATASHSTLVLGNASSAPTTGARGGSTKAKLETHPGETAPSAIVASTDGYRARFSTVHTRTLFLLREGWLLEGIERLDTASNVELPFAVRFHLHPSVYLETDVDRRSIRLTAGDGSRWIFTCEGATPTIESSTFCAGQSSPKQTVQLVLHGVMPVATAATPSATTDVKWQMQRISPGAVS